MKEIVCQLGVYSKLLAKQWIAALFFALDLIAAAITLVYSSLTLPSFIYMLVAVIALFWAGFQVYRDLVAQLPAPAVERAVSAMNSPDPRERKLGIENLVQMKGDLGAREALATAIQHPAKDVRIGAAFKLVELGDASTVPGLCSVLREALHDSEEQVRRRAATALGQLKDRDAIPYLINLLTERDWRTRKAAVEALGEIGDRVATPDLIEVLNSSRVPEITEAAVNSLKLIGTDEALSAVERWSQSRILGV